MKEPLVLSMVDRSVVHDITLNAKSRLSPISFLISIRKPNLTFIVSLLVIFLLPSFFYITLKQKSMAAGLVVAALIVILINYKDIFELFISVNRLIIFKIAIIVILIPALYNYINFGISKPIASFFPLLFIIFSSSVFSVKLQKMHFDEIEYSLLVIVLFMLCLGWIDLIKPITFGAYTSLFKPVFPFSEESHYALCVGLLSAGYAVTARKKTTIFIIINMLLQSLLFPSLTMLLSSVLTAFVSMIRLNKKYFLICFLIFSLTVATLLGIIMMSDNYFSSRLTFNNTNNLTTLVFLQGWSLAFENLISTNGLGLGFQMLGMPGTHLTPFSDAIESITGSITNINDGGLVAAKIIAEFGVIGLTLSLMYFIFFIKFLFNTNALLHKYNYTYDKFILKHCLLQGLIFGFLIEYFFRGNGYFSPGLYLVVAVLISANKPSASCKSQNI